MACAFWLRLENQGGRCARESACVSVCVSVCARALAVEVWGAPSGSAWVFQPRHSTRVCVCARAPAEVGGFQDMLHGLHATQSTRLYMHGGCTWLACQHGGNQVREAHECIDQHLKETCFTRKRVFVMWTTVRSAMEQMGLRDMVHLTHGTLRQALTCTVVARVC